MRKSQSDLQSHSDFQNCILILILILTGGGGATDTAVVASLSSGWPGTPPKAGPVAATRRSKTIPRPRARCPAISPPAAMIRRPKARCSRPERALPPGPSAPAQLTSPADGPGPASLPTEAVCLDREPPQGPPARAGGARVRVIALLDQSPATPGHLIESERAESRAPAPAREQRVRGRAHLLLWMPQTSRLPSVAIICRAGLNAA